MLLNPKMTQFGMACNCHATYRHMCCLIFSDENLEELPSDEKEIEESPDLQPEADEEDDEEINCSDYCD